MRHCDIILVDEDGTARYEFIFNHDGLSRISEADYKEYMKVKEKYTIISEQLEEIEQGFDAMIIKQSEKRTQLAAEWILAEAKASNAAEEAKVTESTSCVLIDLTGDDDDKETINLDLNDSFTYITDSDSTGDLS